MSVIKVRNTTVYEAILTTDPDAEEVLRGWLGDAVGPDDALDLSELRADHAWAIRRPSGEVAFVHPAVFVVEFEGIGEEDSEPDLGFDPEQVIAEEETLRRLEEDES